ARSPRSSPGLRCRSVSRCRSRTAPERRARVRSGVRLAASAAAACAARHLLHLPRPGMRASGLPSPVLKLAWQRRQTYIFELDIIGFTPGSPDGRAATYSACVWRNFCVDSGAETVGVRRMAMEVPDECGGAL